MNQKVIGIPGYINSNQNSFGVGITYAHYFSEFGKVRIIMPWENLVDVDLLVLPGGADLSPSSYGAEPEFRTGGTDVHKQHFYDNKLKLYVGAKIPVFGICLGFQQLNCFFGGTLVQHLMNHQSSSDRYKVGHKSIILTEDCKVQRNGKGEPEKKSLLEMNSHHHQGVILTGLAKSLKPLLISEHEEIINDEPVWTIEAFKHKELNIIGVQHHPEEWFDEFSSNAIKHLLNAKQSVLA